MGTIPYEPFVLEVRGLKNLKWAKVSALSKEGDTWFVEEEGPDGRSFKVSLSDTQRNTTPEGKAPIEREGFPTGAEIKDAIRRAIQSALVWPGLEDIKPGRRYPIIVTCFDLYKAGAIC